MSKPNWVSLSDNSSLIPIPMIEKMVHTAKQTANATVDIVSARPGASLSASLLTCWAELFAGISFSVSMEKRMMRANCQIFDI